MTKTFANMVAHMAFADPKLTSSSTTTTTQQAAGRAASGRHLAAR
jgi:hypothetical protein